MTERKIFKEKTGVTETQWAQVVAGMLSFACYQLGYPELAAYSAVISQTGLGMLGHHLRARDKHNEAMAELKAKTEAVIARDKV